MFKFSFNPRLASVSFAATSVGILLAIMGVHPIGSQNPPNQDSDGEFNVPSRVEETPEKEEVTIADLKDREIEGEPSAASYYDVIVTNNLFRPLGYRKPTPGPSFQLW